VQRKSYIRLFLVLVFALPVSAYALYVYLERRFENLPVYGKTGHQIPPFQFTNQDGKFIGSESWDNKIAVADFFFTRCPSICPKMTQSLKRVQQAFSQEEIMITSFSIDPERDNTKQLKWYTSRFGINTANWQLLTGDKKDIYKLARNGFMIVATDGDGGPEDFIHSEKLVLIDKQKRIRGYYDGTDEKEITILINDIKKLINEN
jgi:protein SCO1